MISTATIHHTHNHGASGWEIVAAVIVGLALFHLGWWLADEGPEWIRRRWYAWQDRHADEEIEDAADLSTCGDCEGTGVCRVCLGGGATDADLTECDTCDGLGICLSCDDAEETDKLRADRYEPRWRNLFGIDPGWTPPDAPTPDDAARAVEESETR